MGYIGDAACVFCKGFVQKIESRNHLVFDGLSIKEYRKKPWKNACSIVLKLNGTEWGIGVCKTDKKIKKAVGYSLFGFGFKGIHGAQVKNEEYFASY